MTTLFLIPTTLSNVIDHNVILSHQLPLISHLQYFIVETAKIGRKHIKVLNLNTSLQELYITEFNKHQNNISQLLQPLLQGYDIGLLSDCGLPAIADPGNLLLRMIHDNYTNIKIIPLYGASSILLALMSSGVNGQNFAFNGYIPIALTERINKIIYLQQLILKDNQSQIIIETPFRNKQLFELLLLHLNCDIILTLAINLMQPSQLIISKSIQVWRKMINFKEQIHKQEVVFVLGK